MDILSNECNNRKIKLLIFDLDGTLADTIDSIKDGVNLTMEKYGFPKRTYEDIRTAIGNGAKNLISKSMPQDAAASEELLNQVYEDYNDFYGKTFSNCDACYDGMVESLEKLKRNGYTIAVLSNKQDIYVKALVKALIPADIVSLAMGQTELPKKPDPTVPLMIAKELGFTANDTAFIGDSEVDVQTALNAGMLAVGCSWGYRPKEVLIQMGAHCLLDTPRELCSLFNIGVLK